MILVDVNLLVYALNTAASEHDRAISWLDQQLNESRVGIPSHSILGVLRLVTNPRALRLPLRFDEALRKVQAWLALDTVWIPVPTSRHIALLGELLSEPGIGANHVPDAHLAALAIEHGLTLCSTDGDFARWRQLKWINPLIAPAAGA